MAPIAFGGIISGIDTTAIVDQIIAARARPIFRLEERIADADARKVAIGDLRSTLANLLNRVQALTNVAGLNSRTALASLTATGEKNVVSVAVDSTAAVGTFTVSVEQLATATKVSAATPIASAVAQNLALDSAGFGTTITTGTFTINGVQITIDSSTVLSDGVDDASSNSILGLINNAGVGVTASVVNDAFGRANLLQVTAGSAITLGSGADTSNFLEAAHLAASPAGSTRTSTQGLGQTLADGNLTVARLSTAPSPTTGSFSINGVTISYDAANESLNDVISKINSSGAGVTATYDAVTDTMILTAEQTGSTSIALQDVSGNFLAATGVLAATQQLGANAGYKIDGGATQYSTSNTVNNALPGVTIRLLEAAAGDPATITIGANDQAIIDAVSKFVEQFNSSMTLLGDLTLTDPDGESGRLSGDASFRALKQSLRSIALGFANNLTTQYTSGTDVGLSFGAVGAELGATNTLLLDATKLGEAIEEDRNAVVQLFAALTVSAAFVPGTGSLASATGAPDRLKPGTYSITDDGAGNLTMIFTAEGSSTGISSTGTITAGGTNILLIPGMTLTAKDPLQAGVDTIVVTRDQVGMGVKLDDLLDRFLDSKGTLDTKIDTIDTLVEDLNEQIATLEDRLTAEQQRLERRFAQMEQAFARFQSQQAFLTALSSQLASMRVIRR